MEELTMTPPRRVEAYRPTEAAAWLPPGPTRFDGRPANDEADQDASLIQTLRDLPGWVTVVGGGLLAALAGILAGGAMKI